MLTNAPPPATRDSLPEDAARRRGLEEAFVRNAVVYGFEEVSTPAFERADLFAARSGPEIKDSLLTFHLDHEEFALRPEMTAPVCRLVASGALRDRPKPHKLFYIAPCYRYCSPHSGRTREFVQVGLELLGEPGPRADAEVIAAAGRFLNIIGIEQRSTKIGTAAIFRTLLPEALGAEDRAAVIGHLDRLVGIGERCRNLAAEFRPQVLEQLRMDRRDLAALQAQIGYAGDFTIADRPAPAQAELAERLPAEAEATFCHLWNVEGYLPEETAQLLLRASRIRGTLAEVSSQAAELLDGTRAQSALADLVQVGRLLEFYDEGDFEVSLGISRGLTFYTGTVFEMRDGPTRLCGGGRYDQLVALFGGEPIPATGCALRLDTLAKLTDYGGRVGGPPQVVLTPADPSDERTAVQLAEALRDRGIVVGATGDEVAVVEAGRVRLADGFEAEAEPAAVHQMLVFARRARAVYELETQ